VLITGANIGLGFEAAIKFAALGASALILGVRSIERGEAAKAEISKRANYPAEKIQLFSLDMAQFSSVEAFAKAVSGKVDQIDVAVLNAGIAAPSYKLSPDGYETTLQVNALSTALLGLLLLPKLREATAKSGAASHLTLVGSVGHHFVKPETMVVEQGQSILEKVNAKEFFGLGQYMVTKLLLMYAMDGIVAQTQVVDGQPDVIVTTVCPSLCRSNLGRDFSSILKIPNALFQMVFARSSEEGSRTIVSGAALDADAHGQFWSHDVLFKYALQLEQFWYELTESDSRKGIMVTSDEGKKLQAKAWAEIVGVLSQRVPAVNSILRAK